MGIENGPKGPNNKFGHTEEDMELLGQVLEIKNERERATTIAALGCKTAPETVKIEDDHLRKILYVMLEHDVNSGKTMSEHLQDYAAVNYENKPDFKERQEEYDAILYMAKLLPKIEIGAVIDGAKESPALKDEFYTDTLSVPNVDNKPSTAVHRPDSEKQAIRFLDNLYRRGLTDEANESGDYRTECSKKIPMLVEYFRGKSFESQMLKKADLLGEMARSQNGEFSLIDEDGISSTGKNVASAVLDIAYCRELKKEVAAARNFYENFLGLYERGLQVVDKAVQGK